MSADLNPVVRQAIELVEGVAAQAATPVLPTLAVRDIGDLAREVDAMGKPRWLVRDVCAEGDYGVLAGPEKAGKSWAVLDLAVSVASGTAWLGAYQVDAPGPVLLFAGEGGKRKVVRRARAVGRSKRLPVEELPIRVCLRAPDLSSPAALAEMAAEVQARRPALVIVDPLYLSAPSANGADLYSMGGLFGQVQALTQDAGAGLVIAHHWNKTGQGSGAKRMSGAGPAAWGRFLISLSVLHKVTEPDKATVAKLLLEVEGDEVPDTEAHLRRRVWADDPDDLSSALNYEVEVVPPHTGGEGSLRPAARRVLAVLTASDGWLDATEIGDLLAKDNSGYPPLKRRTLQAACKDLVDAGYARSSAIGPTAHKWRAQLGAETTEKPF